jgi:DNA-3-methyladenine glycosylase I
MANKTTTNARCPWASSEADAVYHDTEWGVPSRDETHLFEMITLEGAQAGLSWSTILAKREGYRTLFKGFDAAKIARFTPKDVERLMADASIVRNRLKIESTIDNARALCALRERGESLVEVVWSVVSGTPVQNRFRSMSEVPAETPASKALSKALKARGFRFVGPTTMYAFMQACGLVNDHLVSCPRHQEVR